MQSMEFNNITVDNGGDLFQFDVPSGETANVPRMTVRAGRHAYNDDMMVNVGAGELVLIDSGIWSANGGYYPNSPSMSGNIDVNKIQFCEVGIKRIYGDLIATKLQKSLVKGPKSKVNISGNTASTTFIDRETGIVGSKELVASVHKSTRQGWAERTSNRSLVTWWNVDYDTDVNVILQADNSEQSTWVLEVRNDNTAATSLDIVDESLSAGVRRTLQAEVPGRDSGSQYRVSVLNGSAMLDTWTESK